MPQSLSNPHLERRSKKKKTLLHWSPWGPFMQNYLNPFWLEIARNLHNKGMKDLASFWDESSKEWRLEHNDDPTRLSLFEEALLGRIRHKLFERLAPLCSTPMDWKAWRWPGNLSFLKTNTNNVYGHLTYQSRWFTQLNLVWKV